MTVVFSDFQVENQNFHNFPAVEVMNFIEPSGVGNHESHEISWHLLPELRMPWNHECHEICEWKIVWFWWWNLGPSVAVAKKWISWGLDWNWILSLLGGGVQDARRYHQNVGAKRYMRNRRWLYQYFSFSYASICVYKYSFIYSYTDQNCFLYKHTSLYIYIYMIYNPCWLQTHPTKNPSMCPKLFCLFSFQNLTQGNQVSLAKNQLEPRGYPYTLCKSFCWLGCNWERARSIAKNWTLSSLNFTVYRSFQPLQVGMSYAVLPPSPHLHPPCSVLCGFTEHEGWELINFPLMYMCLN